MLRKGMTQQKVGKMFGVDSSIVSRFLNNTSSSEASDSMIRQKLEKWLMSNVTA